MNIFRMLSSGDGRVSEPQITSYLYNLICECKPFAECFIKKIIEEEFDEINVQIEKQIVYENSRRDLDIYIEGKSKKNDFVICIEIKDETPSNQSVIGQLRSQNEIIQILYNNKQYYHLYIPYQNPTNLRDFDALKNFQIIPFFGDDCSIKSILNKSVINYNYIDNEYYISQFLEFVDDKFNNSSNLQYENEGIGVELFVIRLEEYLVNLENEILSRNLVTLLNNNGYLKRYTFSSSTRRITFLINGSNSILQINFDRRTFSIQIPFAFDRKTTCDRIRILEIPYTNLINRDQFEIFQGQFERLLELGSRLNNYDNAFNFKINYDRQTNIENRAHPFKFVYSDDLQIEKQ